MECKRSTSVESLCQGYPAVFSSYLTYCRALRFEDRPDYAYLRRLFKDLFMREGFVNDGLFDWSEPVGTSAEMDSVGLTVRGEASKDGEDDGGAGGGRPRDSATKGKDRKDSKGG